MYVAKMPITVAWFSCGVTSAIACKLALMLYDNVRIYYIETGKAHEDNARFIKECEQWYGVKINIIQNSKGYKNPVDVVLKERYVNGPAGARCTKELKKEVRYELQQKELINAQVFGYEFVANQINRAIRFKEQYDVNPKFPLIRFGLDKNRCAAMLLSEGIELPTMYKLGYNNNNCIGCLKGGKAYWNKIRVDFPDDFNEMAKAEREVGHSCINGTFLDELNPTAGRGTPPVVPDCGTFCDLEYTHIMDKKVDLILSGKYSIDELENEPCLK